MTVRTQTFEWLNARIDELERVVSDMNRPLDNIERRYYYASSCTPDERAILDAMARVPENDLHSYATCITPMCQPAQAERARREKMEKAP